MHEQAPDQLVIIEGLHFANDMNVIRNSPIQLETPNKLVYSFHLYSWQHEITNYVTYKNYVKGMDKNVAFLLNEDQDYSAPLWLGEFGQNTDDNYWKFTI